ncbi:MAG: hypothetical protein AAF386_02945 [Pseudomonadota bacterium]
MAQSAKRPRWQLALWAMVSGWLILTVSLTVYEYVRFGLQFGFLTGDRDLDPVFFSMSLHSAPPYGIRSMAGSNAIIAIFSLPLLLGFGVLRDVVGRATLIVGFICMVMFSGDIMASGYAFQFGATWAAGEAFRGLFFDLSTVLAVFGPGTLVFGWAIWRR